MLSSLLSGIGTGLFNAAKNTLNSVFGGLISYTTGLFGKLIGAFARLPGQVLSTLGGVTRTITSLFGATLKGALLATAGALAGVVVVSQRAVLATTAYGRSISYLSASTGLSARAAGGLQSRLGAVGVDASSFAGQDAQMSAMRNSVFGVGGFSDPNFLAQAAGRFQSLNSQGTVGRQLARQLAASNGLNNEAGYRALATPVSQIREAQRFAGSVRGGLGIDDGAAASLGRSFDLLTGKFKVLGEGVLVRLGQAVLPRLNAGLDVLTRVLERNSGAVGQFIEQGVNVAFGALTRLGEFLYRTGPEAVLGFTGTFLKGLLAVAEFAPTAWSGLLKLVDIGQAGFEWLAKTGATAFDVLTRSFNAVVAGVGAFRTELPNLSAALSQVLDNIQRHPLVNLAMGAINTGRIATAPGAAVGAAAERAATGDDSSGVGMFVGGTVLAALLRRAILGGATGAAAGGGRGLLGGVARLAIANPIVTGTALGMGAIAYGGYRGLQATGAVDPQNEGFIGWNRRMFGRVSAAFTTGDANNYERNEAGDAAERRSAQLLEQMRPTGIDRILESGRAIRDAATNAYNAPTGIDIKGGLASLLAQVPRGSASMGLEARFGASIRGGSESMADTIRRAIQGNDELLSDVKGRGPLLDLLESIEGNTAETAKNTREQMNPDDWARLWDQSSERVVSNAMRGLGISEWGRDFQAR